MPKVERSDEEWRESLTPEQYRVLRQAGTEPPFTGELLSAKGEGEFRCAGCGTPLFRAKANMTAEAAGRASPRRSKGGAVDEQVDASHGMVRTEVRCASCEGIWAMCSPTVPAPRGCATASTRRQ